MTCKQCGAELDKRAKFCYACGAPVEEHETAETERPEVEPAEPVGTEAEPEVTETEPVEREAPEPEEEQPTEAVPPDGAPTPADDFAADTVAFDEPEEEPRKRSRLPVIIGAAAVVVVVALVGLVFGLGGSGGGAQIRAATPADRIVSFSGDDTTVYLVDGQVVYEGEEAEYTWTTLDGRQMSFLTEDGTLYWADQTDINRIEYDVDNVVYAINGGGLLYVQESTGSIGDLYYYDRATGESVHVAERVYHACISPDGKSYAYTCIEEGGDVLFYLVTDGGEPEQLEDDNIPFVVADGGAYLYYGQIKDGESALYVRTPEEDVKLAGDLDELGLMYFNRTMDELLFFYEDSTYISRHGGDRQKLMADSGGILVNTVSGHESYSLNAVTSSMYGIDTDTFVGHMISTYEKVYLLDEDDAETVTSKAVIYTATVSDDGRKLAYLDEKDRLFIIDDVKAEDADAELVASDVEDYAANENLTQFYVLDGDGTAFSVKPGEDPERAAYDIDSVYYSGDADVWYLVSDEGALFYCAFGEDPVRVQTPDDVFYAQIVGEGVYLYLGDLYDCDVYYLPQPGGDLMPVVEGLW